MKRIIRPTLTVLVFTLAFVGIDLSHDQPSERAGAASTDRLLITGDSITQGSSGDYTWRYRLWKKLAQTDPGVSFVGPRSDLYNNVADTQGSQHYAIGFLGKAHGAKWGGSFTTDGAGISNMVSSANPTVLVTLLGSNDLAFSASPAQTITHLRTYISRARVAKPGIDIVVGEVVNRYDPWNQSYWLTDQANEYAAKLAQLAAELNTADEKVVVAHTRNGWNAKTMTWDGTHPNPTGEALIAQRISSALALVGVGASAPDISGNYDWHVQAPAPGLAGGVEKAILSWDRTSTGATGMLIQMRLRTGQSGVEFHELPYAVGGTGWTAEGLVSEGTYDFRLRPAKGLMSGSVGASRTVTVGSLPIGTIDLVSVSPGRDQEGRSVATASWKPATNATGYKLASVNRSRDGSYSTLPYAIPGLTWTFGYLEPGTYNQFRITPSRGFANGTPADSSPRRLLGLAGNVAHAALGDSYSSGLGSNDPDAAGACLRSTRGWPGNYNDLYIVNTSLLACAGATTVEVKANQVNAMKTYFARSDIAPRAKVVTLTVGGNDVEFENRANACVKTNCLGLEDAITEDIDGAKSNLQTTYTAIKKEAKYADVIVGGYPGLLEVGGGSSNWLCVGIRDPEREMINRAVTRLNTTIAAAANNAGVWHVGQRVRATFQGHNACSDAEWIHAGNGDWGGDIMGFIDSATLHPNNNGQVAYAIPFNDTLIREAG